MTTSVFDFGGGFVTLGQGDSVTFTVTVGDGGVMSSGGVEGPRFSYPDAIDLDDGEWWHSERGRLTGGPS